MNQSCFGDWVPLGTFWRTSSTGLLPTNRFMTWHIHIHTWHTVDGCENLHHLGWLTPHKWEKPAINWCRISSISLLRHPVRSSLGFPHLIRDPHEIAIRDGVYPQVPQAVTKKAGELANSNPLDLTWIGKMQYPKGTITYYKGILRRFGGCILLSQQLIIEIGANWTHLRSLELTMLGFVIQLLASPCWSICGSPWFLLWPLSKSDLLTRWLTYFHLMIILHLTVAKHRDLFRNYPSTTINQYPIHSHTPIPYLLSTSKSCLGTGQNLWNYHVWGNVKIN